MRPLKYYYDLRGIKCIFQYIYQQEEYKVKELKRPKCQMTLITDLLRSCGGWQIIRKRQESRMAPRTLGVISDNANY